FQFQLQQLSCSASIIFGCSLFVLIEIENTNYMYITDYHYCLPDIGNNQIIIGNVNIHRTLSGDIEGVLSILANTMHFI
ncbi:hypothetical protein BLOT_003973, partial [Blomia tropicalis]